MLNEEAFRVLRCQQSSSEKKMRLFRLPAYISYIIGVILISFISVSVFGNNCVNDGDSSRLSALTLKSGSKSRWAVVALTRKLNAEDTRARNEAIASRISPFAKKHNVTVVFFSEVEPPAGSMSAWKRTFQDIADVKFINTAEKKLSLEEGGNEKGFGYKYMCKFFSIDMYEYLREFDYYLRLDSDSYITRLKYDIFQWALDNNVGYGYAARKLEAHKETRDTLPSFTQKYLDRCDIQPRAMIEPLTLCFNFYNNFHIGRVAFWLRAEVKHYLQAILDSNGIAKHRWGDSTIQAYAVRMFMHPDEIQLVPDFAYIHGSHANMQVDTLHNGRNTRLPQKLDPLPNKYTSLNEKFAF